MTVTEAAEFLKRSVKTLQRWDRTKRLRANRTATGRRWYEKEQLLQYLGIHSILIPYRRTVAYCRVSSQAQKPDLRNQRNIVASFCSARGLANVEFVEEIGGGLNFRRKKFLKLVDEIVSGEVGLLVIAHKDRLARFGFDLLVHLCDQHDCELLVIDNEKVSPEQEMVRDLMAIVHCFSSRLYGLRNYRKAIQKALKSDDPGA